MRSRVAIGFRLKATYYRLRYWRKVTFGARVNVRGRLEFVGPGRLIVGDGVTFNNAIGRSNRIQTMTPNAVVTIGNDCYFNGIDIIATERVTIGDMCLIPDCLILTSNFHTIMPERLQFDSDAVRGGPVTIGSNVWIGARTSILRSVSIGDDAVIGLGTVVDADVPAGHLLVAKPQQILRKIGG